MKNLSKISLIICITLFAAFTLFACTFRNNFRPPQLPTQVQFNFNAINNGTEYEIAASPNSNIIGGIIIPSTHNGRLVTRIANNAFFNQTQITSINLPDTITHIGNWAFRNTANLNQINIPNSVTYIGNWAFRESAMLELIYIPSSVIHMGNWAFRDANNLTIYTAHLSRPAGWANSWNQSNRPVVWGYIQEDYVPTPNPTPDPIPGIFSLTIINGFVSDYDNARIFSVIFGAKVTISPELPQYVVFEGWFEGDYIKSFDKLLEFYMPNRDLILTARWTEVEELPLIRP
ncbi:MAG: leucine-rich repeat domain-containing protein [Firmicutes bacterium]|nr:leucine-rich repeat domain-containing protein [Bacillota bacterium]